MRHFQPSYALRQTRRSRKVEQDHAALLTARRAQAHVKEQAAEDTRQKRRAAARRPALHSPRGPPRRPRQMPTRR